MIFFALLTAPLWAIVLPANPPVALIGGGIHLLGIGLWGLRQE